MTKIKVKEQTYKVKSYTRNIDNNNSNNDISPIKALAKYMAYNPEEEKGEPNKIGKFIQKITQKKS